MQICVRSIKAGPLVRKHHAAVALPGRGCCVVVGGVAQPPIASNHFVIFSPSDRSATVYTTSANGPKKRSGHVGVAVKLSQSILPGRTTAAATDGKVEGFLMVGGWGGREYGALVKDYWFLDTLTFTWSVPSFNGDLPETVNLGLLQNWTETEVILYRGGDGLHHNSDIWILNTVNGIWRKVKRKALSFAGSAEPWPPERTAPCGCVVPGPRLLVGGGWNSTGILDDWWVFDGSRWTEVIVSGRVGKRTGAKLVYLDWAQSVCLIGGKSPSDLETPPILMAPIAESFPPVIPCSPAVRSRLIPEPADSYSLTFIEPQAVDGAALTGLVGHDACVVGNMVVISGGTDTVHKEPVCGAFVMELLTLSEFSKTDQELHAIFERPIGSFDSSAHVRFAGSGAFADVFFKVGEYRLPCHQLMLAARSEYFSCYLEGHNSPGEPLLLSAPSYAAPSIFELFLTLFYSLHIPTCLMLPQSRTTWDSDSGFADSEGAADKQSMAILLAHSAALNYRNVVDGRMPCEVPFSTRVVADCITMLLVLTQLADQYVCDRMKNCLEIYLATLASNAPVQERLLHASNTLGLNRLKLFIERSCNFKRGSPRAAQFPTLLQYSTAADKPTVPAARVAELEAEAAAMRRRPNTARSSTRSVGDATARSQGSLATSRDLDISSEFSPPALPALRERNYGSGRDLGRRPQRASSFDSGSPQLNYRAVEPAQKRLLRLFRAR